MDHPSDVDELNKLLREVKEVLNKALSKAKNSLNAELDEEKYRLIHAFAELFGAAL